MTAAEQIRFFRTNFGRRPSSNEVAMFELELRRSNLDVMAEALRQAEAGAKRVNRPPADVRSAVLAQYDRIVALNGQLFPVFFVFESAFRTLLGSILDAHYGDGEWWHPVRDAIDRGDDETRAALPVGTDIPREVLRAVGQILRTHRRGAVDIGSTHELMRVSTLYEMGVLLDRHYSIVSSLMTTSVVGGVPTRTEFGTLFKRVRQARNDAYHQLVVRERPKVVSAAERLLDLLDIHLGDRIGKIEAVVKPGLTFSVFREARHQYTATETGVRTIR